MVQGLARQKARCTRISTQRVSVSMSAARGAQRVSNQKRGDRRSAGLGQGRTSCARHGGYDGEGGGGTGELRRRGVWMLGRVACPPSARRARSTAACHVRKDREEKDREEEKRSAGASRVA